MNTREAATEARKELDALGLQDWRLVFDSRPTRRLGQTRFTEREIGLSTKFVTLNEWPEVRLTVRHEAAHAIVGPGYGHGPIWKRKARELGVPTASKRRAENLVLPAAAWNVVCPQHGVITTRQRRPAANRGPWYHRGCREKLTFERGR